MNDKHEPPAESHAGQTLAAAANSAREIITPDELDKMMPAGEYVHTFMQAGMALLGCDWKREDIIETARKNGVELSGEQATAMKHGAVMWDDNKQPVFIETMPSAEVSDRANNPL